tara:strand:+ start:517 stop:777 length:261 start_codon:yes stop_codon:yes gene_type:complete
VARDLSIINRVGNSRRAAYVVFVDLNSEVYLSWKETEEQIHQFSGNDYKGFDSLEEAHEAFNNYQNGAGVRETTKSTQRIYHRNAE